MFAYAQHNKGNSKPAIENNARLTMAFAQYGLELLEQDAPGNKPRIGMAEQFIRKPQELKSRNKDYFKTFQTAATEHGMKVYKQGSDIKKLTVFDRYMLDCFKEGVFKMITQPTFHCKNWANTGIVQTY